MRGRCLVVLVAVFACHKDPANAPAVPSEREYAQQLIAALEPKGFKNLTYDEARASITGDIGDISVENIYQEWLAQPPAQRPAMLATTADNFAGLLASAHRSLDAVRPH